MLAEGSEALLEDFERLQHLVIRHEGQWRLTCVPQPHTLSPLAALLAAIHYYLPECSGMFETFSYNEVLQQAQALLEGAPRGASLADASCVHTANNEDVDAAMHGALRCTAF